MKYISICDGIGAAHLAFTPIGWRCQAVAEIDPQCNAVLDQHWGFENYYDILSDETKKKIVGAKPDLIIGGTPCQSFSVAGLRGGISDSRGSLIHRYVQIVQDAQPRWFVWENVPGIFSIDDGATFAEFIRSFAELGYGVGWRMLDAQYFGVPQVRRRVFVVGCFGDPDGPLEVLFDSVGVPRRTSESDKTRKENQGTVAKCIRGRGQLAHREDSDTLIVDTSRARSIYGHSEKTHTLTSKCGNGISEDCAPLIASTLTGSDGGASNGHHPLVAAAPNAVRRLTPRECERLMGLPDDYTLVLYKGKPMKDSPRYRMIGNSIAVPVLRRIGEAIEQFERKEKRK